MDDLRNIGRIFTAPLDFISKYFKVFVLLLIVLLIFVPDYDEEDSTPPNLAKLYLTTPIYESDSFAAQIEKIIKNKNIKGVLLVIDSPGGSVGASIEIADMVKNLNQKIPVIAYVRGSMASGSYYAGMYAKEIYANRGALVGSIGVIFSGVNIEELMAKIGIKEQSVKAGEYKEVGTSTRQWSEEEKLFIENLILEQYELFRQDVIQARGSKLKVMDYREFAEGKVFSAHIAAQLGLIDKVASMQEAVATLKAQAGVENAVWLKKDKFEAYMDKFLESASSKILSLFSPQLKATL
ncbi:MULTISPECIES: signal peptide peptidase SppA [Helicobacter]|uniref:Protease IV (PspA) n=4 Tax=Helicobacter typhlonius TaxID=76936 RepID=A0A099UCP6_9HELI|nr:MULTISPECIES: signal peptide peptidase SppA [Helicobacter]TLD79377.1 signal peptide peptidase SppA [Helicobacter typhlonius]TLD86358.1 signal peptide peptidase SppA [Helicobacter sp. MIT 03-1616]CUU39539.1 protease IV (PspA) [Helicobacter typhlonius]